ncbi:hypothetical protein QBZ16_001596 [Prototheca wickerhamii]|uniref:NADH dehydrogenase [ubiquinone] 1 beta subcomplex subunit 11, mitochondrial n=1 Tax=Prototheca wickerhamii TaxID=3111 RepID=A0AAD9MJ06_PROWI|nr:hypothetical protein QBZ16_001596 [Prototheca wickerhamii]
MRALRTRGGHAKGSFFEQGHHTPGGYLFGETPPAPGHHRHWEAWEGPWYFTLGAATLMLTLGLTARPDSSLTHWADKEAEKRIDGTA